MIKKEYVQEALGTFFLMLTMGLVFFREFAALGLAGVVIALLYVGNHISGAHYNPLISLAYWINNELSLKDLLYYCLAQLCGGMLATFVYDYLTWDPIPRDIPIPASFIVELLFSFLIVYIALQVNKHPAIKGNSYFGVASGAATLASIIAVGNISSAIFNPVVDVCLMVMRLIDWSYLGLYLVAQYTGALLAALFFRSMVRDLEHPPKKNSS